MKQVILQNRIDEFKLRLKDLPDGKRLPVYFVDISSKSAQSSCFNVFILKNDELVPIALSFRERVIGMSRMFATLEYLLGESRLVNKCDYTSLNAY